MASNVARRGSIVAGAIKGIASTQSVPRMLMAENNSGGSDGGPEHEPRSYFFPSLVGLCDDVDVHGHGRCRSHDENGCHGEIYLKRDDKEH
nr:hypothetical protein [Candidatus Sigynarchaeota archaeon]